MIVTINTDASYNFHNQKGGYAFYIVCNNGKILKSGKIKNPDKSLDCEMKAIANALYMFKGSDLNKGVTKIIINTDCKPAILHIKEKSKFDIGRYIHRKIKAIKKQNGNFGMVKDFCEFRHVKAHTGKNDARSWVNDWCDREAKKHTK